MSLSEISRSCNSERLRRDSGIVPLSERALNVSENKSVFLPSSDGMGPDKELSSTQKYNNSPKFPISVGIVPEILLYGRERYWKLE
jgi:hypothetical protein